MRILHVVWTLDPAAGGPPQVAMHLAAAQAELGHEVVLASYLAPGEKRRVEEEIERVPGHERIVFCSVPGPGLLERFVPLRARGFLRELMRSADFVHIQGIWHPILWAAADVAADAGVPYCFCLHGMLNPWALAQKSWKKQLALALGHRAALQRAAFIHVLNPDEKRLIEPLKLGVPSVVLANGVSLEEIQPLPPRGTFRAAHPEFDSSPLVLFLSRLHVKKGLDVLAEAFARLVEGRPNVRLVVAGPDGGARADFVARVTQAGLSDRVHLVGPLYGRDKVAALADSACFCLPSREEGFSVAIAEAMACSVPVVITDACHFPEVGEAGAGRIVPLDAEAVAGALDAVLADPARAAGMGAAGAELVRSRYTWHAIAARSIEAYQQVMRPHGAGPPAGR